MKEFKGTKGEWLTDLNTYEFTRGLKCIEISSSDDNKWIAQVNSLMESECEENIANSKLIAAAPELLDALQDLVKAHKNGDLIQYDKKVAIFKKAQKAINKAL